MKKRETWEIYEQEDIKTGKEFIFVKDENKNLIRKFKKDKRIKHIKNFHTQKTASTQAIHNYFRSKVDDYKPVPEEKFEKNINNLLDKKKGEEKVEYFKNTDKKITTKRFKSQPFRYMFLEVTVIIRHNGIRTKEKARGEIYHYPNKITSGLIEMELRKAILRALAKYGSNIDFRPIDWRFVYVQTRGIHFDI